MIKYKEPDLRGFGDGAAKMQQHPPCSDVEFLAVSAVQQPLCHFQTCFLNNTTKRKRYVDTTPNYKYGTYVVEISTVVQFDSKLLPVPGACGIFRSPSVFATVTLVVSSCTHRHFVWLALFSVRSLIKFRAISK